MLRSVVPLEIKKGPIMVVLFMVFACFTNCHAMGNGNNDNLDRNKKQSEYVESQDYKPYPFHKLVTIGLIRTYQIFISPSKGSFCPMHPHCSLYGRLAFNQHNAIKAFLSTADRLHRCGHDLNNYPTVEVNGFVRFYDPGDLISVPNDRSTSINATFNQISHVQSYSGTSDSIDTNSYEDRSLFNFAKQLQFEADYERAITEYKRLISYYPNSSHMYEAMRAVFFCYYWSENYLSAIHWGQDLLNDHEYQQNLDEIKFYIGLSYFKVGNYSLAQNYLREIPSTNPGKGNSTLIDKSLLLMGLAFANEGKWDEAVESFSKVDQESKFAENASKSISLSHKGKKIKFREPTTAGLLAIIPGMGYLYDGYPQTAISSLIVNGLFFWATYEAFREKNQSLGAMLSVLSFGWYAGNIYGSVMSAQRKNIQLKNELLMKFDLGFRF